MLILLRRHKIAKRLAQCLHPHLPSGVHLKALEIYEIIFKCMGTKRLSQELFIYSAGLFPVLGFAAMNVRPYLLSMYEVHFVPLGEHLGPALCGFLSGVLPGLEEGSDHYDRTFSLLEKVCDGVGPRLFYGKLWECISTNSAVRLAAITYVLSHFDKRLSMEDQLHIMGTNVDVMVNGLCACVQDSSVLVQRSALDLLLVGFPMHNSQLVRSDMLRLVGAALVTVLRRDMSLNRRLFTWMLGSEVAAVDQPKQRTNSEPGSGSSQYFEVYSRDLLVQAVKIILNEATGQSPHDLKPYKLLISLLDKPEIGPVILDDILYEVFRLLYLCSQAPGPSAPNGAELIKTANLMFSSLEPRYFWQYTGSLFSDACKRASLEEGEENVSSRVKRVGAGHLTLIEVCVLTEFILDTVTVETYSDTPSEHLPSLFLHLVSALREYCAELSSSQTALALGLCTKILTRVQPTIPEPEIIEDVAKDANSVSKDANSVSKEANSVAKDANSVAKEGKDSRSRLDTGNESMRSGELTNRRDSHPSTPPPLPSSPPPATLCMEICLSQYEKFYVRFVDVVRSKIGETKSVPTLLDSLRIKSYHTTSEERAKVLEDLLRKVLFKPDDFEISEYRLNHEEGGNPMHIQLGKRNVGTEWTHAMQLASKLLVELSTFLSPSCGAIPAHGISEAEFAVVSCEEVLPGWLQMLVVCACWLGNNAPSLQLAAISTLLDLVQLCRNQSLTPVQPSSGFTSLILVPLLKPHHLAFLENQTNAFQVIAHWLWDHLGNPTFQVRSMLKMLDNLQLSENCPLKVEAQVWLLHSIMRGDIHRLLDPLLMMLLDPATARLSVLHARISTHQDSANSAKEEDQDEASTKIYAISSVDGNVMYHVSEKYNKSLKDISSKTNNVGKSGKKIVAVTSLSSGDNQCVTEKKRVNQNIYHDGIDTYTTYSKNLSLLQNISVFVNPFSTDNSTSMMNNDFDDYFVEEKKNGTSTTSTELIGKAVRISSGDGKSGKEDGGKSSGGKKAAFKLSKPNVNIIRNNSFTSLESVKNSLIVNPSSVMISSVEFAKNLSNISDTLFSKISDGKRENNKENNSSISNEILPYFSSSGEGETPTDTTGDLVRSWSFSGKESTHTTSGDLEVSTPADEYFKPLGTKSSSQTVIERVLDEMCEYVDKHGGGEDDKTGDGSGEESGLGDGKDKEATPPPCMKDSLDSASVETAETISLSNTSQGHQSEDSPLPSNKNLDSPLPSNKNLDSPLPSNKNLDSPLPSNKNLDSPLPSNKNPNSPLPSNKNVSLRATSSAGNSVESTHAHVLLYCGVYDSARTQYALQTIRNMILPNSRAFLCAAATTALAPRSPILKLLARHRKCLFGRGFHGDIESTGCTYSRSSMYLEVLISVCLYYIRSYYLNLGQTRLTLEEIAGNRQVQIASVELLSVILSELAGIVRDSGKGLSCYLADLLGRCKVQKVTLHCILASVISAARKPAKVAAGGNFVQEILSFNSVEDEDVKNNNSGGSGVSSQCLTLQIQLLKLLLSALILEHEVNTKRGEVEPSPPSLSSVDLTGNDPKYYPGRIIPQQPMFLCALARALESNPGLRASHQHWTTMLTCALPYLGKSLTTVVKVAIKALCANVDYLAEVYSVQNENKLKTNIPADYAITQMEALTILCHYCLLDSAQPFNQPLHGTTTSTAVPSQIFNNLVHVFIPSPVTEQSKEIVEPLKNARSVVLNCLRRILSSLVLLWESLMSREQRANENSVAGSPRVVKSQLLELLSPIALHHGPNFLAAFALVWKDRRNNHNNNDSNRSSVSSQNSHVISSQSNEMSPVIPVANERQKSLVQLLNAIKAMPIDTLVQTIHQVIRSTTINMEPSMRMEVSVLELLLHYIQLTPSTALAESWPSLLLLLREGPSLSPPSQFILMAILSQFVHRTSAPLPDRRDQKDLQDITAKLIESCAGIAGACLEQTTWLRRNLAVKEDELSNSSSDKDSDKFGTTVAQHSVQALSVLAQLLAPLLDVTYGSQEKERVNTLLTTLMYNVIPYLKNHSQRNAVSFHACSTLLASLSSYQYTRKAWKKDAMDLLLDPALFQMELRCLRAWKSIVDNLMSQEPATFRDLMTRVSLSQSNSLSLFSNKEQEYEQRAQLLKKLAFVILCSETDQFHKHIPEITVPGVQAQVFLCFRVLLLRMSPSNVTSMWPNIVSEMVQVFLLMEQDLAPDTDENSCGRTTPPESQSSPTSPVPNYRASSTPKTSGSKSVLKKRWRKPRTPNNYNVQGDASNPADTADIPTNAPEPCKE
ncbi:hypothetical protein M8J75_010863 [Diaphorina citri]|nr:hypothetical protein M8J75_010863 [Diaphorina citri]